ncbi:SWR1 complex subunit 2-like isoform X3 [Camellia sinensis]|uniref:SWR1 complex subunit 2-like isoform X3 n=1 Tax=Camellia sinensis TaxID=4442 RepID=UPI001036DCC0|nr:SWR1 complex subunit 2-like isoform X3 [Camellia sinensis]
MTRIKRIKRSGIRRLSKRKKMMKITKKGRLWMFLMVTLMMIMRTKKILIFPGKQLPKKKTKKKVLSNLGKAPQDDETAEQSTLPEHHDAPDDVEVERIVRKSTRTSVIVRQAERDAIRAALQATMKGK